MKVLLAAGGTAGHIEPALTLADTLRAADDTVEIVAIGREDGLEARLIPARGYRMRTIPAVPLPRRASKDLALAPGRVSGSLRRVTAVLREERPDVVVGFGGYVALPAYLAARRLRLPLVIHEANARAGLANRVGARLTPWVAEAVPGSLPGATHVGMPLRASIRDMRGRARTASAADARRALGLDPSLPTLLVFGGSLGAQRLNVAVTGAAEDLTSAGIQVLHAAGERGSGMPEGGVRPRSSGEAPYIVVAYLDRMDLAYAAADLAVTRAGAMTCAELAAVGLPAVYVPLPIGNGEQRLNAEPVVAAGGGLVIDDADFTAQRVRDTVIPLALDGARLAAMRDATTGQGVADGDERLADLVRAAARLGGRPS